MKKLFDKVQKKKDKDGVLVGKVVMVGQYSVKVEAVLGEGGYSTVYRALAIAEGQPTGQLFALKHMRLAADTDAIKEVQQEAKTMARLKGHLNILRLHAVAFAGPQGAETDGFMLLDYCPVSLLEIMQKANFQLDDFLVYEVFQDVCHAVAYMHKSNPPLAHRDLKAENVLKNSEGRWVICDFGSSTSRAQVYDSAAEIAVEEDMIRRTTTPAYRAPEMWDLYARHRIDTMVDIWALGVLLYVLSFGKLPFPGDSKLSILYGKYDMPPGRPPALRALIQDMLQVTPANRPDIFQVLSKLDLVRDALTCGVNGMPPPPVPQQLPPQPLPAQAPPPRPPSLQQQASFHPSWPEPAPAGPLQPAVLYQQDPGRPPLAPLSAGPAGPGLPGAYPQGPPMLAAMPDMLGASIKVSSPHTSGAGSARPQGALWPQGGAGPDLLVDASSFGRRRSSGTGSHTAPSPSGAGAAAPGHRRTGSFGVQQQHLRPAMPVAAAGGGFGNDEPDWGDQPAPWRQQPAAAGFGQDHADWGEQPAFAAAPAPASAVAAAQPSSPTAPLPQGQQHTPPHAMSAFSTPAAAALAAAAAPGAGLALAAPPPPATLSSHSSHQAPAAARSPQGTPPFARSPRCSVGAGPSSDGGLQAPSAAAVAPADVAGGGAVAYPSQSAEAFTQRGHSSMVQGLGSVLPAGAVEELEALKLQVQSLTTHNHQMAGRVRQLESTVVSQGVTLQQLVAEMADLRSHVGPGAQAPVLGYPPIQYEDM